MGKWSLKGLFSGKAKQVLNKYNEAFFWGTNGQTINDDNDLKKYIDLAYNINPDVYSIVTQISNKIISVPYGVREVVDVRSKSKLDTILKTNNHNLNFTQRLKALKLENKAFTEDEYGMPIERPNSTQTWDEFFKLSSIFLDLTGNVYWYKLAPENGMNKGRPVEIYVLPSHLMEIVLKENASFISSESPIDYFILKEYNSFIEFKKENVVHIAINNPNFGFNGQHLYGQSPLRAAWKNIEASNKGLDLNYNILKNGGAFGFIHGKNTPLNSEQAKAIKSRVKEMNADKADMGRISGISTEIGFTRLSLSADELKPFEYLKHNQKALCNVLGWSDSLLNNDDGGKHDKQTEERKRVVTDTVIPHIKILEQAFNSEVMPYYKELKNYTFCFDVKEIPELQADLGVLSEWVGKNVDRGLITRNEGLLLLGMPENDNPKMNIITVKDDIMTLDDALLPQDELILNNIVNNE